MAEQNRRILFSRDKIAAVIKRLGQEITRDYGETANDKVNELVEGLVIAVITVVGLIGLTIGSQ